MNSLRPQGSPVAFGGMMAALAVVLGLVGQLLPLFGALLAPLPLALCALVLPLGQAAVSGVAAAFVVGMLTGLVNGVQFAFSTVLFSVVLGVLVRARKGYGTCFAGAALAKVTGAGLAFGAQILLAGVDLQTVWRAFSSLEEDMLQTAEQAGLYESLAASGTMTAAEVQDLFVRTVHVVLELSPAIYVLRDAALVGAVMLVLHAFCSRLPLFVQVPVPQWRRMIMPPAWTAGFILAWMCLLAAHHFENTGLWICAANVMVIGAAGMVVDGFSYTLARLRFSERPLMWQFIYVLIAVMLGWYLIILFAFLGVFDSIADYRQLRTAKGE